MRYIVGGIFIVAGIFGLFSTEPFWHSAASLAIGYLLIEKEE